MEIQFGKQGSRAQHAKHSHVVHQENFPPADLIWQGPKPTCQTKIPGLKFGRKFQQSLQKEENYNQAQLGELFRSCRIFIKKR